VTEEGTLAMNPHSFLGKRIDNISEEIDSALLEELRTASNTLRTGDAIATLLRMSRMCLRLVDLMLAPKDLKRPNDNLFSCIARLGKGDEKSKVAGIGILPDIMASHLHCLRTMSNKPDHLDDQVRLTAADAEIALVLFLRVVEWFYCEYRDGKRLPELYRTESSQHPAWRSGLIKELARVAPTGARAEMLLVHAQLPAELLALFQNDALGFWTAVCNAPADRVGEDGLARLVGAVRTQYPGNDIFAHAETYLSAAKASA
jgi:hypothetical protein